MKHSNLVCGRFGTRVARGVASAMLGLTLAVVAGCQEDYPQEARGDSTWNTDARSNRERDRDRLTVDVRDRDTYRSGERGELATSTQRRSVEQEQQQSRRSRESSRAAGTQARQEGDRTHYTMAYPTGDRDSSVMLIEKIVPTQVRLNQPFQYEIRVTNITDATLDDVRIREDINEGMRVSSVQVQGQEQLAAQRQGGADQQAQDQQRQDAQRPDQQGQAQTAGANQNRNQDQNQDANRNQGQQGERGYDLGNLKPRESRTIQVTAVADKQGQIGTCLLASYQPSLCAAVNVVNPQLRVVRKAPDRADICENIVFEYQVTNSGTGTTAPVIVREQLPEGLTTEDGKNEVALDAGRIREGETRTGRVRVKAAKPGQFTGRAVATSEGGLQAESEQSATTITQPRLAIDITGPESEYVDRPIQYQVTVRNEGDAPARDSVVAVNVPSGTKLANVGTQGRADRNSIQWNLGTIEPQQAKTATFTLTGTQQAALSTAARAKAVCADEVSDTAQTKLMTIPALVLEVVDLADPVRVGENVTYRIQVTNQGSGADNDIVVTAELPPQLQYVSARGQTQATAEGQVVKFAPVQTLPPGRSVTWELTAKASEAGDIRFEVELDSEALTKPAYENEPTRTY